MTSKKNLFAMTYRESHLCMLVGGAQGCVGEEGVLLVLRGRGNKTVGN